VSIHWPIIKRCLANPGALAIVDDRRSYRRGEILVAALNLASVLRARCRSATVGVLCPTSGATPIVALAAWIAGKAVVPLNYLLTKEELAYVIADSGVDTIVSVGPMIEHLGHKPDVPNMLLLEELDLGRVPDPEWPAGAADDDLGVLLYTSGTSGHPKGVMLTHANIQANIRQILACVDLTPKDTILGVLPQFHSFGLTVLTLMPLTVGIKTVFAARFVPQRIVRSFREHRPTFFVAIPTMYNALLSAKDAGPEDFATLRYAVSGAEPLPDAVSGKFMERFGVRISEGYGLTETSPATNICLAHNYRAHSVGPVFSEMEQIIADPATDAPLPAGVDGEIRMRGPNVMAGYFKLEKETRAVFDRNGYFKTGDIGRLDEDGFLYITGRLKEMMIVGGENVFPREIEDVLNRHPDVEVAGVTGDVDAMRGEIPVAFVQIREGHGFDEKALLAHCRESLAGYKVPREIRRLEQMPRNPTGKVMRRELKKLLAKP